MKEFENHASLEKNEIIKVEDNNSNLLDIKEELNQHFDYNELENLSYFKYLSYFYLNWIYCNKLKKKNLILEFLNSSKNLDKYSLKSYINMKTDFDQISSCMLFKNHLEKEN